jgi:NADH:ubiquinone oxidoreductase subunit 4 (subunit M)
MASRAGGAHMLEKLRKVLDFQLTIGQLLAIGLIIGTPYLLVGTIWSTTHTEHLHQMQGVDLAVSFLGSIVSWPVLLFANVCMT